MTTTTEPRYFVRQDEIAGYHPANHTGTLNKRLIGPETVGAKQLEVLVGHIQKGKGALPHAHPGIEQVCYMLEGRAVARWAASGRSCTLATAAFFRPTRCTPSRW